MTKNLPRGLRNNNPLNLRKSNNSWQGKIVPGSDPAFEQFDTIEHGLRAALINIRTYINRDGINTPFKIISRWAPASDANNPELYTKRVCAMSGLLYNETLRFSDKFKMCMLVWAMAYVECGQPIALDSVKRAYAML